MARIPDRSKHFIFRLIAFFVEDRHTHHTPHTSEMVPPHFFHASHHRRRRKGLPLLPLTLPPWTWTLLAFAFAFISTLTLVIRGASAECCYPKQLSSSSPKCGDGSPARGYYCGRGGSGCNVFGCNCAGGCRSSSSLRFKAGDIIACEMVGLLMGLHTLVTFGQRTLFHTMLAVSDSEVIHESVELQGAELKREPFFKAKNDKMHCHVETEFFDEQASYYWDIKPFPDHVVVARAEAYAQVNRGKYVRYDPIDKNCEHWVTFWRYGIGFNLQLHPGQPTLNGMLRYFGLRPKIARTDNFEGQHRISWNGTLLRSWYRSGKAHNFYVGPLMTKPKYSGICWRNSDCYSRRCDRTDLLGHEFGYCEVIKLG